MNQIHQRLTFNFADLLSLVARIVPDRTAIVCGEQRLSYEQLDQYTHRVAAYLRAQGVGSENNVGLQLYNHPAYLVGFFASCRLGAIPFNINYRYTGEELAYLYRNSDIAALLYDAACAEAVEQSIANIDTLKTSIPIERNAHHSGKAYEEIIAAETVGDTLDSIERSGDDLVMIYTGGTTGMPKGVMWPHKALFFSALGGAGWYHPAGPISEPAELESRVLEGPWLRTFPVAPLMHGAALWTAIGSLLVGHTLVLDDSEHFSAERIWDLTEREQVNIMSIVGDAMALPLIEALEQEPKRWNLAAFRHLGSGGALFSESLQDRLKNVLPEVTTNSTLGATETGAVGPGNKNPRDGIMRYDARPDLAVVVGERLAEPGETGTLARRGYLPVGYYGDEQKTRETFVQVDGENFALGGDAARLEEDGSITVLGRGSACINTGGEKVFPEEVEQVLKQHPAVADALVVGLTHPRWGQQVAAVVELEAGAAADFDGLVAHCRGSLAGYKLPKEIRFALKVQRNVIGKPDYTWARQCFEQAAS